MQHAHRLRAALIEAARECGLWFDAGRGKPQAMVSGAAMSIPPMRVNGAPPKLRPEVAATLAAFKEAVLKRLLDAAEADYREEERIRRAQAAQEERDWGARQCG